MSVKLKKVLDLPDPRRVAGAQQDVQAYLSTLNESLQDLNRHVRDALISNRVSGTAIIDNGTTRMTVVIDYGAITSVTTAASSGTTLSWTAS